MGYLLGIVGKPNVGKSTYFSAATLAHAQIANYPFTTIKPNKGVGYARIDCVCKEFGIKDQTVNSICIDGIRLIPVEIIDCAGLVPGAWQGKGLGNQFLDEIRTADVLVHIIDTSGSTDIEGKICDPGDHDPIEDINFLENEIEMWFFRIIKKNWDKISRTAEGNKKKLINELVSLLSGLSIKRNNIIETLDKVNIDQNRPKSWTDDNLLDLVRILRKISKPILIIANKMDAPKAEENFKRLRSEGYEAIPCCAEAELALRRASKKELIKYIPGDSDYKLANPNMLSTEQKKALLKIKFEILEKFGSTGVQKSINYAFFDYLKMLAIYPVVHVDKLTDHKGRILPDVYLVKNGTTVKEFAHIIHSELGEGFIYALDARKKIRLSDDYALKSNDIISIVSASGRVI
jgi:ribosome-binding ATPase YchF (GTP1/OBG family)